MCTEGDSIAETCCYQGHESGRAAPTNVSRHFWFVSDNLLSLMLWSNYLLFQQLSPCPLGDVANPEPFWVFYIQTMMRGTDR